VSLSPRCQVHRRAAHAGVLLLTVACAWACGEKQPRQRAREADPRAGTDTSRVQAVTLRGHKLLAGDSVAAPSFVAVVGRYVIAIDERADSVIKVVNRVSGQYVRSFGRRGRGPGEFEGPWSITSVEGSSSAFWVYDATLRRLTHVDLDADFLQPGRVGRRMLTLKSGFTVLDPAFVDTVIVAVGFLPSGRLAFFSDSGELIRTGGGDPPGDPSVPVAVRNHAYQAELAVSPDRTRLAVANRHAGSIEFYRADGTPVSRVSGPLVFDPILLVARRGQVPAFASDERLRFGYIAVAATRDRVFALFSGRTRRDFPGAAAYGRSVHVFDWEGRLLQVYDLEGDALAVAVDSAGTTLYVAQHEPEPAIVSYHLGEVTGGR